ncbi:hypothetical protein L195_g051414, partial [Trifolium pratense]
MSHSPPHSISTTHSPSSSPPRVIRKDLESSEEVFDVESLYSFSKYFFDYLSQLSEEEFLSVSEKLFTPPEDHIAQLGPAAALPQEIPPVERKYFPWLTLSIVV